MTRIVQCIVVCSQTVSGRGGSQGGVKVLANGLSAPQHAPSNTLETVERSLAAQLSVRLSLLSVYLLIFPPGRGEKLFN